MRSSSGHHFIALDHVRALAAFMVFAWHFLRLGKGLVPYSYQPEIFPLALLDEGHTGVALFMALSGYLFAKLLDGKDVNYSAFLHNRALRLLPLLVVVIFIAGAMHVHSGRSPDTYIVTILDGLVRPTLPNGGWSITVEAHYYLVLPAFLWMLRRSRWLPLGVVVAAILLRLAIRDSQGEVQSSAYWTIVGRVDQFVLGMLAFHFRGLFAGRHFLVVGLLVAFSLLYWIFDAKGGFYQMPEYPSPSLWWVYLPTAEGMAYGMAIAWYDNSFRHSAGPVSTLIARAGEYSYSIYLLHLFFVQDMAEFVQPYTLGNFYVSLLWAAAAFLLMMPLGWVSYRYIESPFLRLRKRYLREADEPASAAVGQSA